MTRKIIGRSGLALCGLLLFGGAADATPRQSQTRTNTTASQQRQAPARTATVRPTTTPTATAMRLPPATTTRVGQLERSMEHSIKNGATPFLEIVPARAGVRMRQTSWPNYKTGEIARFEVSGLDKSGKLDLVALLPVSGHVGRAEADRYAKSNQYNLVVTHADGTRQALPKVASTGYVTQKDLGLSLKPGKTSIEFWADGSAGVGGYVAGRRIELSWNGD
jgi:hypothetical protein